MIYRLGDLDLSLGPFGGVFDGLSEAKQASIFAAIERMWLRRREEFLAEWVRAYPGTRPWAWWAFEEAEAEWPLLDDQPSVLRALGALSAEEEQAAVARN